MKTRLSLLVAFSLLGLAPASLIAQSNPKVVVVDMAKLYDGHPKTAEQNVKLKADEKTLETEITKLNTEGNALVEQFKQLSEQMKSPALAADAKTKATEAAQTKAQEIQKKNVEVQQFRQNAQNQLQQRVNTFRAMMLREIAGVVTEIAKRKGATLVLDKSGPSLIGISPFIYVDPTWEITDEVMKELNKDRPVSAAAPEAAPPAADGPTVTFPGSKKN